METKLNEAMKLFLLLSFSKLLSVFIVQDILDLKKTPKGEFLLLISNTSVNPFASCNPLCGS